MQPGTLRRRIDIQVLGTTKDSFGGIIQKWNTVFADVPCSIESISGREYFAAQQVQSSISVRITMRWRPGTIDPTMRAINYKDQAHTIFDVYNIEAVIPDLTGRRELVLMCTQRFNDGFMKDG